MMNDNNTNDTTSSNLDNAAKEAAMTENAFDPKTLDGLTYKELKTKAKELELRNLPVDPKSPDLIQAITEHFMPKKTRKASGGQVGRVARVANDKVLAALAKSNKSEVVLPELGLNLDDANKRWLYAAIQRLKTRGMLDQSYCLLRGVRKSTKATPTSPLSAKDAEVVKMYHKHKAAGGSLEDLMNDMGILTTPKNRSKMIATMSRLHDEGHIDDFLQNNIQPRPEVKDEPVLLEDVEIVDDESTETLTEDSTETVVEPSSDEIVATDLDAA